MKNQILLTLILFFALSCGKDTPLTEDIKTEDIKVSIVTGGTFYNGVESLISATAVGEIKSLTFYFDGKSIGAMISGPFEVKFTPKDLAPIEHEIKVIAESQKGNAFTVSKKIKIELRVGDPYQGGRIYYLDGSKEHGLIASTQDLHFGNTNTFLWGPLGKLNTTKDNGQENTRLMAEAAPEDYSYLGYYFKFNFEIEGFTDWYIPSVDELELLKTNKSLVGGFTTETGIKALYWSSTDANSDNAFAINVNALMGNSYGKQSRGLRVRPIRKF